MPHLLDTNHCIYLLNGLHKKPAFRTIEQNKVLSKAFSPDYDLYMSEATLGEMYFGAVKSTQTSRNLRRIELLKMAVMPMPIDQNVWRLFGETKAILQKQGKTMSDLDILIACTAKTYNFVLVTNDSDFDALDFRKENWTK